VAAPKLDGARDGSGIHAGAEAGTPGDTDNGVATAAGEQSDGYSSSRFSDNQYTDADLLAILMREPFNQTPATYAKLSDWQILHCVLAARDDDGLIPIKERIWRLGQERAQHLSGFVERPMPTLEELAIPASAFALMPKLMSPGYIAMYWQRLLNHGVDREEILQRWQQYAADGFNSNQVLKEWPAGMR
jgi:hypothetical protein